MLDSLWRWMKRGVEGCHRSDRPSFMASLRVTQYQDKLAALGASMRWMRTSFPQGVGEAARSTP
eukprot:1268516-Amphidinium_carterae.1